MEHIRNVCLSCIFSFTVFISCKKNSDANHKEQSTSGLDQIFEQFWTGVNTNYVYWDIDTTDWDKKYDQFKPLFQKLNINDQNDVNKSITYFKQMTITLVDSHFQALGKQGLFNGVNIYPADQRKKNAINYHYPYDYSKIDLKYFDQYQLSTDSSLHVTLAVINTDIVYFSCNQFSLLNSYKSSNSNPIHIILDSLFARLENKSLKTAGVIIDVRNNHGGNLTDLNFLIGHFITKPLDIGYSRYKSNQGRLDYTPWIKASITPVINAKAINCPLIVLTDNYTISLAEIIAMSIHLLPKGKIVGETTWGATGPLAAHEIFNDGQFEIGNFLSVRTSSSEFKYIDGKIYEGIGFPPDIPVPFNEQLLNKGIDSQLEKAISLIH